MSIFNKIIVVLIIISGTALSDDFRLHWGVESNFVDGNRFRSEITLINHSGRTLHDDWSLYFNFMRLVDPESIGKEFILHHINGDFYRIDPSEHFKPLQPGEEIKTTFKALGSAIKEIDAPDGAYFEMNNGEIIPVRVVVEPFIKPEQVNRSPDDILTVPTPEIVFKKNSSLSILHEDQTGKITPAPRSMTSSDGVFTITENTSIYHHEELAGEANFLSASLEQITGVQLATAVTDVPADGNAVRLQLGEVVVDGETKQPGDQAYSLSVMSEGISITGTEPAGVFYGIQSLRALIPVEVWKVRQNTVTVDAVTVEDAPGFRYRGLHLDVSRNFQSVESVKRLLDVMAFYKLNKFHFHLTDDEGWRLAINAFPELTEVGGRRGHTHDELDHLIPSFGSGPDPDVSMGSGWYTQEEYIDILRYANERHIEVIPEIDVPGHARAALIAMQSRYQRLIEENNPAEADRYRIHEPEDESEYMSVQRWKDNVINVCQKSTYRFLDVVFDELIDMHRTAGAPLTSIHIGGDEVPHGVWRDSPKCQLLLEESPDLDTVDQLQVWFFGRMKRMLAEKDIVMSGWEEIALVGYYGREKELNPNFAGDAIPYVWSNIWRTGTEEYSYMLANAGYEIVMAHASNFYFDFAYNKHPEEAGLYWAGFVDTKDPFAFIPFDLYKSGVEDRMGHLIPDDAYDGYTGISEDTRKNILGLQGQLWGETFRSPERVEYMALPRIISLAERAWNPDEDWMGIEDRSERLAALSVAWNEFANRLGQRELPRLDKMNGGYEYRIPPPGAAIENGILKANVSYPGLEIRYTTDGTTPAQDSSLYKNPVEIDKNSKIMLRTFDSRGRGSRVVSLLY